MKKVLIALEILIILIIGGALIFIYSGAYNIAATDPTSGIVGWVLETTRNQSVENYAEDIRVPNLETLNKEEGFKMFDGMCVQCHGAPGVKRQEFAKGLDPKPPELSDAVSEWTTAELFWIIRHGLKMTGMPGFGPTHSEEQLWSTVAFLRTLPDMASEEYQSLRQRIPRQGGHGQHPPQDSQENSQEPRQ